jgi:hypothetical protein
MTGLTDTGRRLIARARELAGLRGPEAIRGHTGETDVALAYVYAFGQAQVILAELADSLERTAEGGQA